MGGRKNKALGLIWFAAAPSSECSGFLSAIAFSQGFINTSCRFALYPLFSNIRVSIHGSCRQSQCTETVSQDSMEIPADVPDSHQGSAAVRDDDHVNESIAQRPHNDRVSDIRAQTLDRIIESLLAPTSVRQGNICNGHWAAGLKNCCVQF